MARRTGGVLKKDQRTKHRPDGFAYTVYGINHTVCAICGSGPVGAVWTLHLNVARGLIVVAATCSEAHAMEFEVYHRDEIDRQWAGRQLTTEEVQPAK